MACLTAPPPIELPEDACTSESVVVSGHDASFATERKGWRVLRTAENGGKGQRLMVVLPSPARIHSIQLNTKNCGRISIFVSGAETGPNNFVGQANVAASFRGGGGNVVEALAPCTLTQQDAALNITIGKGDGKLNPTVAQNVCEKLYINVHPHPALEPGALFGISRLEIIRQLSDAESGRERAQLAASAAARPAAAPVVVPMRPMPHRPQPSSGAGAGEASRAAAAAEPAPKPKTVLQRPRGLQCGCDAAGCVGCGPPCKNHGQKARLQKAKKSGKPFWACPLPGGCGFQRDALETLPNQAQPDIEFDDDDDDGGAAAAGGPRPTPPRARPGGSGASGAGASDAWAAAADIQTVLARQREVAARQKQGEQAARQGEMAALARERERERTEARRAEAEASREAEARDAAKAARRAAKAAERAAAPNQEANQGPYQPPPPSRDVANLGVAELRSLVRAAGLSTADCIEISDLRERATEALALLDPEEGEEASVPSTAPGTSVAPRKKARMGPSPPRTAKEAAKEVAQGGAQGGEDSAATEEDSDTDVDEEDECWDEDDDEEHVERAVERAIANPTKWPPQEPPCNYGAKCYRQNPKHIIQFSHPAAKLLRDVDAWTEESAGPLKRLIEAGGVSCAQCSDVADLKELLRTSLEKLKEPRPLKDVADLKDSLDDKLEEQVPRPRKAPPKVATPPVKPPAKKRPSLVVD